MLTGLGRLATGVWKVFEKETYTHLPLQVRRNVSDLEFPGPERDGGRERERQRERETERDGERDKQRHRERQRETQRKSHIQTLKVSGTDRVIYWYT